MIMSKMDIDRGGVMSIMDRYRLLVGVMSIMDKYRLLVGVMSIMDRYRLLVGVHVNNG